MRTARIPSGKGRGFSQSAGDGGDWRTHSNAGGSFNTGGPTLMAKVLQIFKAV